MRSTFRSTPFNTLVTLISATSIYLLPVYKVPFAVISRKLSGYPEGIENTGFRLKACRNDENE